VRELLGRIWTGALILSTVTVAYAAVEPLKPIQMDPKEPAISSNVTKLIEELHYSQPHLDNSLSSAILDRYLDTLDGNRMYFTATDVASFNQSGVPCINVFTGTHTDYHKMMAIVVKKHNYHGFVGIEYEGGKLTEPDGIRATKKLLERVRAELMKA